MSIFGLRHSLNRCTQGIEEPQMYHSIFQRDRCCSIQAELVVLSRCYISHQTSHKRSWIDHSTPYSQSIHHLWLRIWIVGEYRRQTVHALTSKPITHLYQRSLSAHSFQVDKTEDHFLDQNQMHHSTTRAEQGLVCIHINLHSEIRSTEKSEQIHSYSSFPPNAIAVYKKDKH